MTTRPDWPPEIAPPAPAGEVLRRIVEGTSGATGADFFRSLVRHLAAALGTRYAFVGELVRAEPAAAPAGQAGSADRVRVLAGWAGDGFTDNFEYSLKGSPCEGVIGGATCNHPRGVAGQFPDDRWLAEMGIESYLGTPLLDTSGESLGLLTVLHDRPTDGDGAVPFTLEILRIFAGRAAAELQRLRREQALEQANAALRDANASLRRTYDALEETERRHRARIDASPVGVFHADARGRVTYANAECARLLGVSPADALGAGWSRHLHADDRDRVLSEVRASLEGGTPYHSEHRFAHRDGRVVWVLSRARAEHDAAGDVVGYVGMLTDITERRLTEQALRDRETQLRLVMEQVPAMLWTTDTHLRFTSQTGSGLASVGLTPGNFMGRSLLAIGDQPDWEHSPAVQSHRRALAGASVPYEQKWSGHWFQCHVEPLREPGGGVTGVIGIALDITDRKASEDALRDARDWLEFRVAERTEELRKANDQLRREIEERKRVEEDLRQSQARYASILNSQQTLVARSDMQGRITYVNAAHQRTFGSKVGDSVYVNVHPEDVEATKGAMADLARSPHMCTLEQRCEVRGQWRTILWQGGVIRDRLGQIVEYQAVGFDITGRRHAEELLRESERRARENEQRARDGFRRAQDALDEARQVAEFNRRLAQEVDHRVRNNLAGLLSLVSAMRSAAEAGGTRNVKAFAEAIEGRLLAMSHVHRLLAESNWRSVDLRTLVTSLLEAVKQLGRFTIPVKVDGPAVLVSPRQTPPLSMILMEWFTNSSKYGAHSAPTGRLMVVWAADRSQTPNRLRLHWTETGGPPIGRAVAPSLGTELVEGFASLELRGRVDLRFPEEGADHVLEFPLE